MVLSWRCVATVSPLAEAEKPVSMKRYRNLSMERFQVGTFETQEGIGTGHLRAGGVRIAVP